MTGERTVKARFDALDQKRAAVLRRARQCAELTIPSLLPYMGHNETSDLPTPWQGLGARGVNNLASKLLLALLPPNQPFYRYKVDEASLEEIGDDPKIKEQIDAALAKMERRMLDEIEAQSVRVTGFEILKYLVVTGNALAHMDDKKGMRVYRLDHYVVKRDPKGNVLEIVTKEMVSPIVLPESGRVRAGKDENKPEEMVEVYTRIIRTATQWEAAQEFDGTIMPETTGTYPLDACPWFALRWTGINGEDYGRGLVEEYLGDLRSLDVLMQGIVEGNAAAAKVLFLVSPNGLTDPKKCQDASNCDFIPGNEEDISTLQVNKFADFQVALDSVKMIQERLEAAFMLNSSVQRQAERVTAEEIRYMARELEDTLGGVYSVLSKEFQLPLISRVRFYMENSGDIPRLPKQAAKLIITTGLEALGRSHELVKLNTFMGEMEPVMDEFKQIIDVRGYANRVADATGTDLDGLVISEDDEAAAAEAAKQEGLVQGMMSSPAASQVAKGMMEQPAVKERIAETYGGAQAPTPQ